MRAVRRTRSPAALLFSTGLLFLCCVSPGWSTAVIAAETLEDAGDERPWYEDFYDNWYQIEVVVFTYHSPPVSDEIWPLAEPVYPYNMVAIGPERDEDIKPDSLSQLNYLLASEKLWPAPRQDEDQARPADDFMFGDKSRFSRDPVLAEIVASRTGQAEDAGTLAPVIPDHLFRENFPRAFRALPDTEFDLSRVARSLTRSSKYRLLHHLAWRQPLNETPYPVLLQAGERYDGIYEVDGTLTVTRSRFLHVATDLWFTEFSPNRQGNAAGRLAGSDLPDIDPDVSDRYPQLAAWARQRGTHSPVHVHPLSQSRRMRSGTMHFIDHPFFGVIIKVKEFEHRLD